MKITINHLNYNTGEKLIDNFEVGDILHSEEKVLIYHCIKCEKVDVEIIDGDEVCVGKNSKFICDECWQKNFDKKINNDRELKKYYEKITEEVDKKISCLYKEFKK